MKATDFSKTLTKYFAVHLPGTRNLSANTIGSYSDTFRLLLIYCEEKENRYPEKLTFKTFDDLLILRFLEWLQEERKCGISTRNQRLAAIHAFCRYAQTESPQNLFTFQKILQIPLKKHPREVIQHLSVEQTRTLLSQPGTETKASRRDTALLSLLYDTGARVQELCDLRVKDIRLTPPATVTLTGKGSKTRIVPIMGNTVSLLKSYMDENRLTGNPGQERALFFNQRNTKLTRGGINHILQKYNWQASAIIEMPTKVTPHVLRHTKAMHLYQAGVDLIYIRDILGHVDISTTDIYARADVETKRKALEKIYPDMVPSGLPDWVADKDLMEFLKSL